VNVDSTWRSQINIDVSRISIDICCRGAIAKEFEKGDSVWFFEEFIWVFALMTFHDFVGKIPEFDNYARLFSGCGPYAAWSPGVR
jgi:hypothetical protein